MKKRQNRIDRIDHAGFRKTPLEIDLYMEFRFEGQTPKMLKETFRFPDWYEDVFRLYRRAGGTMFDYAKPKRKKKLVGQFVGGFRKAFKRKFGKDPMDAEEAKNHD